MVVVGFDRSKGANVPCSRIISILALTGMILDTHIWIVGSSVLQNLGNVSLLQSLQMCENLVLVSKKCLVEL